MHEAAQNAVVIRPVAQQPEIVQNGCFRDLLRRVQLGMHMPSSVPDDDGAKRDQDDAEHDPHAQRHESCRA